MSSRGYDPANYRIIPLLQNEEQGQLQKIAKFYDGSSNLIEEYKTFPKSIVGDVALGRTFNYSGTTLIGETAFVTAWTADYEANATTPLTGLTLSNDIIVPSAPVGTLVGTLEATGGVGPFTFSFLSNPSNLFSIENINELVTNSSLGIGSYSITIQVEDSAGQTASSSFNITVTSFLNQKSLFFNGSSQYVDFGTTSDVQFDGSAAFSISVWARREDTAGSQWLFGNTGSGSGFNQVGYNLYFDSNANNRLIFQINGTGTDRIRLRDDTGISLNTWHHIAVTYDGSGNASGVTIYIDGSSITLNTLEDDFATSSSTTKDVTLGAKDGGGNGLFGFVDEPSLWDIELSGAEVTELYNSGEPGNLLSHSAVSNLIHWWRNGDGDTFPTIEDEIASLDGTMTNMVAGNIVGEVPT